MIETVIRIVFGLFWMVVAILAAALVIGIIALIVWFLGKLTYLVIAILLVLTLAYVIGSEIRDGQKFGF